MSLTLRVMYCTKFLSQIHESISKEIGSDSQENSKTDKASDFYDNQSNPVIGNPWDGGE